MTIGNIPKDIRRERSTRAWICIGLLPTIKIENVEARMQWHAAVHHILQPLRAAGPLSLVCYDGFTRKCYLILNGWIADWPEQCTVALIKHNRCPVCKASTEEFGKPKQPTGWRDRDPADYMSDDEPVATRRRHGRNPTSSNPQHAPRMTGKQRRTTSGILPMVNEFEEYPGCSPYLLWHFDWLHVCVLGLVKSQLMTWIRHYLIECDATDQWEVFLQRAPPYPELTVLSKKYSYVQQWQGKDICQLIRCLLASLSPILKPANERRYTQTHPWVLLAT